MSITILAIESSCDDTSAAVICDGEILSNIVSSQLDHRAYGGVVPEVASRAHMRLIVPVVDEAIAMAGVDKKVLSAIAFTRGPGLMGSLLVGVSFAKSMAMSLDIPIIEVNHMDAHIMANFIDEPRPQFPFLCLTVSGGHTQISIVRSPLDVEVVGKTIDDAAGEAFDKTGKIIGLGYPAGPEIDKLAQHGSVIHRFPEPQIAGYDFSFSGLKTSILYFIQKKLKDDPQFIEHHRADLSASVQDAIVRILVNKLVTAARDLGMLEIAIAGGVAANSGLRNALKIKAEELGWNLYIPAMKYCTDNAAMIAIQAHHKYLAGQFAGQDVSPVAKIY